MFKTMKDFIEENKNTIFRYWIKKEKFTPYEKKMCYEDESLYINEEAYHGYITECIDLNNGDYLLAIRSEDNMDSDNIYVEYYKLSSIDIAYADNDQEEC